MTGARTKGLSMESRPPAVSQMDPRCWGSPTSSPTSIVPLPDNAIFKRVNFIHVPREHTKTAIRRHSVCRHDNATTSKNQQTLWSLPAGLRNSMTPLEVATCQHVSVSGTHASAPARQHVRVTPHKRTYHETRIMSAYQQPTPQHLSDR